MSGDYRWAGIKDLKDVKDSKDLKDGGLAVLFVL
jgi:hypothetical protein